MTASNARGMHGERNHLDGSSHGFQRPKGAESVKDDRYIANAAAGHDSRILLRVVSD